jgi:L-threonylcarbamoyladenylate synthase
MAAEVLDSGGLVAFPTDTVYALAAGHRRPGAVARLAGVKGRQREKPLAVLLADPGDLGQYARTVPELARKLAAQYWPGPLTLVIPARGGGTIGVRLPDHALARAIVRATRSGVAATSANISGERDALTADEVAAILGDRIDLIIAGGPACRGRSSSVVRVTLKGWQMLREGEITARQIQDLTRLPPLGARGD